MDLFSLLTVLYKVAHFSPSVGLGLHIDGNAALTQILGL